MTKNTWTLFLFSIIFSQWSQEPTENTPICIDPHNQNQPLIVTDDNDGAIIVWDDQGYGGATDIYAQLVDRFGYIQWDQRGVPICTAYNYQLVSSVVSDDSGGVYIFWSDYRNYNGFPFPWGEPHGYIQHISSTGEFLWQENGIDLNMFTPDTSMHWGGQLVRDGNGGVIAIWSDGRRPSETYLENRDIYAQRITYDGYFLWDSAGVEIDTLQVGPYYVIEDGFGGAIITQGNHTYKLNNEGEIVWNVEIEMSRNITNDGFGGVIWSRTSPHGNGENMEYHITAYKLNINGESVWGDEGILITTLANSQTFNPDIAPDYEGGAFFVWRDDRAGYTNLYTQHINNEGEQQWETDGLPLSFSGNPCYIPGILSYSESEIVYLWSEEIGDSVYVKSQMLNSQGISLWDNELTITVNIEHFPFRQELLTSNGVITVWDEFDWGWDIYAQQFNLNGVLGQPFISGDLNSDGIIDILDILITVQIILGEIDPNVIQIGAGDLNGDFLMDILDIILILNIILNE